MSKPRVRKPFTTMTTAQLRAATKEFDRELIEKELGPLTADEGRRWASARAKPGRPRKGAGARVISVSVERGLLIRSDALAKNLGISRASLVERGLKAVLAAEGRL